MSDRDRLAELRRQRALLLEHLAWLDGEIDEAAGGRQARPAPTIEPPAVAAALVAAALKAKTGASSATDPVIAAAAEPILEEYRVPPEALKTDIRKGCLLYFVGAFVLLGVAVVILYFLLPRTSLR